MNIFRKRLSDYDWLTAVLPLFDEQKQLVDDFGSTLLAQGSDETSPEMAVQASVEAFVELHKQTKRQLNEVARIGTPKGSSAKQAHESFQETLKLWKLAMRNGREYSRILARGVTARTLSGGISGRLSSSAMVFQGTLFSETMKKAHESLEYTGQLIESLEKDLMSITLPSRVICGIPFGKELLDGMTGVTTLLDTEFEGWEPPPYTLLAEDIDYEDDEQAEIDKATAVHMNKWSDHMDRMAPEHKAELYEIWVARPGVETGLLEAASNRCLKNGDYQGALISWFKWITHRSRSSEQDPNPAAWVLLTEIYVGMLDIAKAKKALLFTIMLEATELENSASHMDRRLVRLHLLPKTLEQLDQLRRKVENLVVE